ncbi:hypothetical protein PSAB6_520020 [Paraburkholderia sabiae]|nr:hypothetical protein PSAB6_520020 [Paraburkholderia sabiae]
MPPHAYSPIAAAIAIGVAQISFMFMIYLSRVGDRRRILVRKAGGESVARLFDRTINFLHNYSIWLLS